VSLDMLLEYVSATKGHLQMVGELEAVTRKPSATTELLWTFTCKRNRWKLCIFFLRNARFYHFPISTIISLPNSV